MPEKQFHRQDDLEIIWRVQGVAVVADMAGLKGLVVDPSEKREHMAEKGVQPFRAKHSAVPEFVDGIDQKCGDHSVDKDEGCCSPPGPVVERIPGGTACAGQDGEVAERLDGALEVAFRMKGLHGSRREFCPIPGDGHIFADGLGEVLERRFLLKDGIFHD